MDKKKDVIIRQLNKDDKNQYISLIKTFRPITTPISDETFDEIYDKIFASSIILVMEMGKSIIGAVTIVIEQKFIYDLCRHAFIEDLIVEEKFRNRGFGSMLIQYCINYCKKNHIRKITTNTVQEKVPFYTKNSFEERNVQLSLLLSHT